jgi:putative membrane protein
MSKIDRQREHQANERTFLAWLRTSIALIGFGLTISRFGLFLHELQINLTSQNNLTHSFISSQTIGISLVIVGIIVIILAVWRYNQVFLQIEQANYQPNRLMVWITAAIVIILGLLSIPFLLWRMPTVPNNSGKSNRKEQNRPLRHQNPGVRLPNQIFSPRRPT